MSIGHRHVFSWLHLSDLHFGHGDSTHQWDQQAVLDALRADIEKALQDWPELPRPQAIMVTGDIAFSGNSKSSDEYAKAFAFFEDLTTILAINKNSIYMIPGNHDVQRTVAPQLIEEVRAGGHVDKLMADAVKHDALLLRQENYKIFADQFAKRDLEVWIETLNIPEFGSISIVGLNSSLFCTDDKDKGQLHITGKQRTVLSNSRSDQVRIVLSHHPVTEGWLAGEDTLRSKMQQHHTVHLCGHVHDPRVDLVSSAGSTNHIRVVAAAAHRDPSETKSGKDSHGYNFASLLIDPSGMLTLRTWPRRWFPNWNSFHVDHLGVPDRGFHDDKQLGKTYPGSGLTLDNADKMALTGAHWWGTHIAWDKVLSGKSQFDVFGISLRTLFEQPNSDHVKAFLEQGGVMKVVLADPRNRHCMSQYEADFGSPAGDRTRKVVGMLQQVKRLQDSLSQPTNLIVRITPQYFKYSGYRIDGDILFVPYRMTPGKTTAHMPGLLFDKAGSVAQRFFTPDLDGLFDSATPFEGPVIKEIFALI